MAQGPRAVRTGIQAALAVAIAVGVYVLYRTITDPWERYQAERRVTALTRARMDHVRAGLVAYRDEAGRYPPSLNTLVAFVEADSAFTGRDLAEVFAPSEGAAFDADSLPYSPRTGRPFVYEVVRDDSADVELYYLQDPDIPEDYIGAREPDPARRNAASWE